MIPKRHKTFVGHIALLMSGKVVAAAIALVLTPVIARLFDPGDFGIAALFFSLSTMLGSVASLRYENALVIAKDEADALPLLSMTFRVLISVCLVLLAALALLKLIHVPVPYAEKLGLWIWAIPLSVFLMGFVTILENWLTRTKEYRRIGSQ